MDAALARVKVVLIDTEGRERTGTLGGNRGNSPVRIGRAPENDLQVISPYVSRRHAELWGHSGGALFRDLGSTSGSWYQGRRVTEMVLPTGETIHLGSPDGIPVRIDAMPALPESVGDTGERAANRTEVLRVADFTQSVYLGSLSDVSISSTSRRKVVGSKKNEERLRAIIALTSDLLEIKDGRTLADVVLRRAMELLPVERGMVLLTTRSGLEVTSWLERVDAYGDRLVDISDSQELREKATLTRKVEAFQPIHTVIDRVSKEGVGLLTLDALADQRLEGSQSLVLQSVRSILAAPIASGGSGHGVIYLDTRRGLRKDDDDALDWIVAAGRQAGLVMDTLGLLEQQRRMLESLIKGLAASIDARDGITAGHSARVAHYSLGIARAMALDPSEQNRIYYAALLHDYGKIGVDDAVLKKPGSLTNEEYEHIRKHPRYTYDILSKIEFPPEFAELPMMAASHHERVDGKGYPFQLAGENIPLAGRIIAIADVYDALTQVRHYRTPMPIEEVLTHLEEGRNTRFDTAVLDAFFRYHKDELELRWRRKVQKRERSRGEALDPYAASGREIHDDDPGPHTTEGPGPTLQPEAEPVAAEIGKRFGPPEPEPATVRASPARLTVPPASRPALQTTPFGNHGAGSFIGDADATRHPDDGDEGLATSPVGSGLR